MINSFIVKVSLFLVVVTVIMAGIWLLYRYYVRHRFRKLTDNKHGILGPVMQKLAANKTVKSMEIESLVKDASMRYSVYLMLCEHNREDLFPVEYLTHEKGAESFLANWLEFPTELGAAPDEIELIKKVFIEESTYYVFKYKTTAPHWAARNSWMLGVSGPYVAETLPYDIPRRVFSRFNTLACISAEDEAYWVHKHIRPDSDASTNFK